MVRQDETQPMRIVFEAITYMALILILFAALIVEDWRLNYEILGLSIILTGYTLVLVLPITRFKIGASGIEGEISRLKADASIRALSDESAAEASALVAKISQTLVDPRSIFLDLSIEIEKTLRELAASRGLPHRIGMGELVRQLRIREVLTDKWLLEALQFFIRRRNLIVHEGKVEQIQSAIDIGTAVLARLNEIKSSSVKDE